jgi:hypothetical protein
MNYQIWKQYQNYIIIGIISLISLFFLPMLGAEVGLQWNIPTTAAGWVVYVISKLLVAVINILIFHCFVQQGKVNSLKHPNYIEAQTILGSIDTEEGELTRSPAEILHSVYGKKGVTIFVTSTLSAIGLTQAILTFDFVSMLTYLFTIILGIIFGLLQMSEMEIYWTEEYLRYAKRKKQEMEDKAKVDLAKAKETISNEKDDSSDTSRGTHILEPADSTCVTCANS